MPRQSTLLSEAPTDPIAEVPICQPKIRIAPPFDAWLAVHSGPESNPSGLPLIRQSWNPAFRLLVQLHDLREVQRAIESHRLSGRAGDGESALRCRT